MPIELHCEHCGKLVRAPDSAAGRHGKCPACHQSVYIPTPAEQVEPLELAPLDDEAERERERLRQETYELQTRILHERDAPAEGKRSSSSGPEGAMPAPEGVAEPVLDVHRLVIDYVVAMAGGRLSEAEEYANELRRDSRTFSRAEEVMDQLAMDELLPPELEKIPRPVLMGFFKQLRAG